MHLIITSDMALGRGGGQNKNMSISWRNNTYLLKPTALVCN